MSRTSSTVSDERFPPCGGTNDRVEEGVAEKARPLGAACARPLRRASRFAGAAAALLAIAGCATAPRFDAAVLEPTELADVPFFPQTEYQCGPAALATILAYEGVPVDAGDLAPAVYVEGLRGSLQAELLGATRRRGLVPYPIEATPETLFDEVAAGKPVLVLQNLGLKRLPVWHYAVVIGFDDDSGRVLLRSGTERRRAERLDTFLRSWRLGGNWGFVAAAPGELPATATPERYVRAVAGAESLLSPAAADAAYAAAADRWPEEPLALFALAGRHAGAERWDAAATAYRTLLRVDPDHAAARNNLANVLAERGCRDEALRQARAALDLVGDDSPLRPAIEDTVESLSGTGSGPEPGHCRA